jgi:release factor glutamine methyltransferase
MTRAALLQEAVERLAVADVPCPRADAERLLARSPSAAALWRLVGRRAAREPLAHVLGEAAFRGLQLAADRRAFVPRPGTEVVVDRCLALLRGVPEPRVLDVGTGSGAIALAIADEHPTARVTAVDVSGEALALARENAVRTGLADRVQLREGDLLSGLAGLFDLVVSNPPYLPIEALEGLEPETRLYEPRLALVGERLAPLVAADAYEALAPGGRLVLECGGGQAETLVRELRSLGYEGVLATPDREGRDRVVEGSRPVSRALAA